MILQKKSAMIMIILISHRCSFKTVESLLLRFLKNSISDDIPHRRFFPTLNTPKILAVYP